MPQAEIMDRVTALFRWARLQGLQSRSARPDANMGARELRCDVQMSS